MRAILAGLKLYQLVQRTPRPPEPAVLARAGRARLVDFGGVGEPVIFVPSLINPAYVLDLAEGNSLLRGLAGNGVRPLLVDWGDPLPEERDRDLGGHVMEHLLPLIDSVGAPYHLAGYCLGGTLATAAAIHRPPLSLTLIASPWHFRGFPDSARAAMTGIWRESQPIAELLGALPMESLQTAFWMLDPERTVTKYERFGRLDPQSQAARAFVLLEDWANGGAPIPLAAARELAEDLFTDDITGKGEWRVGGRVIDPAAVDAPVFEVVSTVDKLVPDASAARCGRVETLALGHVGMIVGAQARTALWEPLAHWLSHPGRD
jgi:polyhydroxyalkanoate synthase